MMDAVVVPAVGLRTSPIDDQGTPFQEFVAAVRHNAKSDGAVDWQSTAYWICTFSNNQWEASRANCVLTCMASRTGWGYNVLVCVCMRLRGSKR